MKHIVLALLVISQAAIGQPLLTKTNPIFSIPEIKPGFGETAKKSGLRLPGPRLASGGLSYKDQINGDVLVEMTAASGEGIACGVCEYGLPGAPNNAGLHYKFIGTWQIKYGLGDYSCEIDGNRNNPLVFQLKEEGGLIYVSGQGVVKLQNGQRVELPIAKPGEAKPTIAAEQPKAGPALKISLFGQPIQAKSLDVPTGNRVLMVTGTVAETKKLTPPAGGAILGLGLQITNTSPDSASLQLDKARLVMADGAEAKAVLQLGTWNAQKSPVQTFKRSLQVAAGKQSEALIFFSAAKAEAMPQKLIIGEQTLAIDWAAQEKQTTQPSGLREGGSLVIIFDFDASPGGGGASSDSSGAIRFGGGSSGQSVEVININK